MGQRLIDLIKGEKLVAWALVAFAFLFVTNAIFAGIIYSNVYDSVYHGYATSKHEAARKDEFESRCSQITAVEELRSCFERHIETGWETQRAQEDLNAQKEMADWTFWMLIVTGAIGAASIVLTVAGIWLVYLNLREARIVSKQATAATEAAQVTVDVTRHTAEAQLRAYVGVDAADIKESSGRIMHIAIRIKNSGLTPAKSVQTATITENGLRQDFPIKANDPSDARFSLFPGTTYYTGITSDQMSDNEWEDVRKLKKPLYVWGRITYQDAFSTDQRETTFRFKMGRSDSSGNLTLFPCEEGNSYT